jgi:hypothetical protein
VDLGDLYGIVFDTTGGNTGMKKGLAGCFLLFFSFYLDH